MTAAVAATPASGSITAVTTAVRVTCSDIPSNDTSAFVAPTDAFDYPTEPALVYYFKFSLSGQDDLISPLFTPASDGTGEWNNVILPADGTWTLDLCDSADDSVTATASVVVA